MGVTNYLLIGMILQVLITGSWAHLVVFQLPSNRCVSEWAPKLTFFRGNGFLRGFELTPISIRTRYDWRMATGRLRGLNVFFCSQSFSNDGFPDVVRTTSQPPKSIHTALAKTINQAHSTRQVLSIWQNCLVNDGRHGFQGVSFTLS